MPSNHLILCRLLILLPSIYSKMSTNICRVNKWQIISSTIYLNSKRPYPTIPCNWQVISILTYSWWLTTKAMLLFQERPWSSVFSETKTPHSCLKDLCSFWHRKIASIFNPVAELLIMVLHTTLPIYLNLVIPKGTRPWILSSAQIWCQHLYTWPCFESEKLFCWNS